MRTKTLLTSFYTATLILGPAVLGCGTSDPDAGNGPEGGAQAQGGSGTSGGGEAGDAAAGESGGSGGDPGNEGGAGGGGGGEMRDGGEPDGAEPADAGDATVSGAVAAADVCERLSTIQCSGEASCCNNPGRDFDACKQIMKQACETELTLDQIAMNPVSGYDAQKAGEAFDEFERLVDDCVPNVVDWAISREGFAGVVEGTIDEGDDCTPPEPTVVTVAKVGAALVSCRNGAEVACLPKASGWTCQQRSDEGGPCYLDTNCKEGLYCLNPALGYDGVCTAQKALDAPCLTPNECASFVCKQGICAPVNVQNAYCLSQL